MSVWRSLLAWVLLAAFGAGGTVAPVVHHVQHGLAQDGAHHAAARAAAEGTCHSEAAHQAEAPALASERLALGSVDCALCATRHLSSDPVTLTAPAPLRRDAAYAPSSSARAPVAPVAQRSIRGPPVHG